MREELILNGRHVGEIDHHTKCYISFRGPQHWFRIFNGWGISTQVLDYLIKNNIDFVVINDNNLRVWFADVAKFLVHGEEFKDGDDEQLILKLDYWNQYQDVEKVNIHPELNIRRAYTGTLNK